MPSSQSFSMIQRRISLSPEPAPPVNKGERVFRIELDRLFEQLDRLRQVLVARAVEEVSALEVRVVSRRVHAARACKPR